jgi:HipA-like protein
VIPETAPVAEPLQAVQHIRKMRGGSQAHLIRASDSRFYVMKFSNNPQHLRILANEYLGSRIGAMLGLPMPEVRVIEVSDWLVAASPELTIETGEISLPCANGLQLGSRYVADPEKECIFDYLPEAMLAKVRNLADFPRVLAFDKWTCNSDGRQVVFVKSPRKRLYEATFIDQGYCFNAGDWDFPDIPLRGAFARKSVYAGVTGWKSFEPVLSRIEQIDIARLSQVAHEIPEQWYEGDHEAISRLVESLHQRRLHVRDLVTSFRTSSRNPFPSWTGT